MEDLNKKLAEICGVTVDKKTFWSPLQGYRYAETYTIGGETYDIWNPIKKLEQLQKCYRTLNWEQKAIYKQLVIDHDVQSVFESPDQHAELILRAKQ
jgi:23S rRNA A2030 N6-methylase RlmJ